MGTISERIKTLRNKRGITQQALADELGVDRTTISKWETRNGSEPDSAMIIELASVFGVSTDYLLGRTDNPDIVGEKNAPYRGHMPTSLEEFLQEQEVMFDGVPMTEEERQSVLEALRAIWRMKYARKD